MSLFEIYNITDANRGSKRNQGQQADCDDLDDGKGVHLGDVVSNNRTGRSENYRNVAGIEA